MVITDTQDVAIRELVDAALENKDLAPLVSCLCSKAYLVHKTRLNDPELDRSATFLRRPQSRQQQVFLSLMLKQRILACWRIVPCLPLKRQLSQC